MVRSAASSKPKAAPRKKNAAPAPAATVAKPTSALDVIAQDEAQGGARACRRLRRRSSDEMVAKCLKDNFPGWDAGLTDLKLVSGMTLRETIRYDKKRCASGAPDAPSMGKRYYEEKRDAFCADSAAVKRLRVSDESQPLNDDLAVALSGLNLHIKRFDRIMDFFDHGPEINQLSLVCLLKHALKVSSASGAQGTSFNLALLRYIHRHNIHTKFPNEFELIRDHLDDALCRSWKTFQSRGLSSALWWRGVAESASLILDPTETEKCIKLGAKEDLSTIETELATLVQSSQIGMRLFGSAWTKLSRGKMSTIISEFVTKLIAADITPKSMETNRQAFIDAVRSKGRDPMELVPSREVDVRYRGCLVPMQVSSLYDEYSAWVTAVSHGYAVDLGVLVPLFCENELVAPGRTKPSTSVSKEVVAASAAARAAANELLAGEVHTAGAINAALESNKHVFTQLDRAWRIEAAFYASVSGSGAEKRLHEEILACLPSESAPVATEMSLRSFDRLAASKLLEFCGLGLQATFRTIRSAVESIGNKAAPSLDKESLTDFMKTVTARLVLFCCVEVRLKGSAQTKMLQGDAAVVHFLETRAKMFEEDPSKVTLKYLEPLAPFTFALNCEQAEEFKKWADAAMALDMSAGASAAVAKGKGKGKGARKKATRDAKAMVYEVLKK